MYLDHFGLNEPPFRITPHTDFFFQGANRGATLEALLYAVGHDEGIVKVSGEVGSGKTMLCRVLIERLPKHTETVFLANPSLSRDEILFALADELKLEVEGGRTTRVLRALQDHLIGLFAQGRRVVVLIDEAHAMPKETLEEIRLLSNLESDRHKLLQIVLFGQPELDEQLDDAGMRQLKERITQSFRLEPLVRGDIESYIDFRMRAAGYRGPSVFTSAAIRRIAEASEGLTRRVNILADKSLLAAFAADRHAVTEAEVKRAVRDSEFHRPRRGLRQLGIGAAALAAGVALGLAAHRLLFPAATDAPAAPVAAAARAPTPVASESGNASPQKPTAADARQPPEPARAGSVTTAPAAAAAASPANADQPVFAKARVTKGAPHPVPPAQGELVRARFDATQEWLRTAPGDHFSIQLVTVKSTELPRLENFLRRASALVRADELFVYSVKIDGQQHYRAALGSYPDVGATLNAMHQLPPLLKAQLPYHRSVERMRSQNRQ